MIRVRRAPGCAAALALALLSAAPRAEAAEAAPIFGAPQKREWLHLDPVGGELAFITQLVKSTSDYRLNVPNLPETSQSASSDETLYQERLTLHTGGYILSPRLVEFQLAGTVELDQDSLDTNGTSASADSTLYLWDVSARILGESRLPSTVYTRRTESLVNQSFGPTLQQTQTTYGGDLAFRSAVVPTQIRAYRLVTDQKSLAGDTGIEGSGSNHLAEDVFQWHSQWSPTKYQQLLWDYYYDASDQSAEFPVGLGPDGRTIFNSVDTSTTTQTASLTHNWQFGSHQQHELRSALNYQAQSGLFAMEMLRWDEMLRMRWNPDFETFANFSYNDQTIDELAGSVEQTQERGVVGFRHQLYESLFTNGSAGLSNVDSGASTSVEEFLNLGTEYRKKIPYGLLIANLGGSWDHQDNSARSTPVTIIDQPQTFTDPLGIVLRRTDIVPGSIRLRSTTSPRIFLPTDYRVITRPDGVQILPRLGGPLGPNDSVLVTYDLAPEGANTITTTALASGLRYEIQRGWLKGLSPYVTYSLSDQSISSSGPIAQLPDNTTDLLYGAEYYTFWDLVLTAEQEHFTSTLNPFDATRFKARMNHRLNWNTTLGLNSMYALIDYPETGNTVNFLTVGGSVEYRLTRELSLLASATYRRDEDSLSGNSSGTEEQLEIQWARRQLTIYGILRYTTLDSTSNVLGGPGSSSSGSESFMLLQVGISREF